MYRRLAGFLGCMGIEIDDSMLDLIRRHHWLDMRQARRPFKRYGEDDDLGDEDGTLYLAAAASDARDIKPCGCEWNIVRRVLYKGQWCVGCSMHLIELLEMLGVIRGEGSVEATVMSAQKDECGAW